jgi:hypothetical protein
MRVRGDHRVAVAAAALAVAAGGVAVGTGAAAQAPGDAVIVRDARDGDRNGLDLTRVQLARAADGRLRAALTLAAPWRTRDLPAREGPPGSLCLRLWSRSEPVVSAPDHLVCITSDARGRDLRGSVLQEADGELRRIAGATLARTSGRTVTMRFAQSAVGRPASLRFSAEVTSPGCDRPACVDVAPDPPVVSTLRLRAE